MILSLTGRNFEEEVQHSSKPVVIEVYATWCGPCQHMMPLFEDLAKEYSDKYKFTKLNVDEAREIAIEYGIASVPTFVFIKNNQVVGKEVGVMSKEDFLEKFEQLFS